MDLDLLRPLKVTGQLRKLRLNGPSLRKFGVPPGGPIDRESFRLAQALVGGSEGEDAYELIGQAVFQAASPLMVGIVGAPAVVTIDRVRAQSNGSWPLREGGQVLVEPRGAFAVYLAIGDGPERRLSEPPSSLHEGVIRVVPGPQATEEVLRQLADRRFRITLAKDRVGIRLEPHLEAHESALASEPACPGAVQLTNSGQLIVLGPDGPTIGGYPKVAVVIEADLDRLGQLAPGSDVTFAQVDFAEAERVFAVSEEALRRRIAGIELARQV